MKNHEILFLILQIAIFPIIQYLYMYIVSIFPQTCTYVSDEILRMEPDEGSEKLQLAFHVCRKYRENYEDRRAHLSDYFKEEPVVEWDFEPSLVFARVDRFTCQLRLIEVSGTPSEELRGAS